jgi:hypothetical protein
MAKGKKNKDLPTERAKRQKLSAEESLKRMREFAKRKERFIATVRKGSEAAPSSAVWRGTIFPGSAR